MAPIPGDTIVRQFTTRKFADGIKVNADSLPTGTVYKNGVANAISVTVANIETGLYKASATMTAGAGANEFAAGDDYSIEIDAIVDTVTDQIILIQGTFDGLRNSGLENLSAAEAETACESGLADYDAATGTDVTNAHSTTDGNVNSKHTTTDNNVNSKHSATDVLINALNDLSSAQAQAACAAALAAYGAAASGDAMALVANALDSSSLAASAVTEIVTGVFAKVVDGTRTFADVQQLVNAVFRGAWSYDSNTQLLTITNEDSGTVVWNFSVSNTRTTN